MRRRIVRAIPKTASRSARVLAVLLIAACLCVVSAAIPKAAFADSAQKQLTIAAQQTVVPLQTQKAKRGWVSTAEGKRYYRNGASLKHLAKIGDWYYYFDANGLLRTSDLKLDGVTLYIAPNGRVIGAYYKKAYYGKALTRLAKGDVGEFEVLLEARSLLSSICEEGDSQETMRRKAFDWVVEQPYRSPHASDEKSPWAWIAYQAHKVYEGEGGNCQSLSAAYSYFLAALGESPLYLFDIERRGSMHTWVELDGKRYDPAYAAWQGYDFYYAASGRGNFELDGSGWIEYVPVAIYAIPHQASADADGSAKVPAAILDVGKTGVESEAGAISFYENGKRVRNAWRTIGSKRYYFNKAGEAVTGGVKIGGKHYVFNSKGELARSSKSGLHTVKVSGEVYRADKRGRAVSGWSASGKRYFDKTGKMLSRAWKTIGKARHYFGADGVKATGPTRVGKANYLFSKKGALIRGTSRSGSLVRYGSRTYRIDKAGRAVAGWSADHTKRFSKSGLLLTGTRVVSGKLYAADRAGTYLPERTAQLKAASAKGSHATDLRRLLGKPKSEMYSASCNFDGDDGVWEYKHFYVFTARPKAVAKRFATIEDAIAAEDAAGNAAGTGASEVEFERIASIAAK